MFAAAVLAAQPAASCDEWNTEEFFRSASVEDVTVCLAAGADVHARDESDFTPLHWAAYANQDLAVVEALLAAGAEVSAGVLGITPLHMAAEGSENPAVLRALLAAGADLTARTTRGGFPVLHWAARNNENPAVTRALMAAGADPSVPSDNGQTVLHAAAENPNPAVAELLLASGANVMARDDGGNTPLHLAGMNENPALVETLLAAGANPIARTGSGTTPLHNAAVNENPAVVEALIAAGVDVMARDTSGETALHVAARRSGTRGVFEALLVAGTDLEARDEDGNTPLHLATAALFGNPGPAINALLDAGADATARNAAGQTPWDLAQETENDELRGSDAYWRLNDARFNAPQPESRRAAITGTARRALVGGTPAAVRGQGIDFGDDTGDWPRDGECDDPRFEGSGMGLTDSESQRGRDATDCRELFESGRISFRGDNAPERESGRAPSGGRCEIPGYPNPPGGVADLGLPWCSASVNFQRRAFALQAAGAWCAIDGGSSSTAEQVQARHQEINAACDALDAMRSQGIPPCQCPAGYRP